MSGNVLIDPDFLDPDDGRISRNSPLVDAGTSLEGADSTDAYGSLALGGFTPDIGMYEVPSPPIEPVADVPIPITAQLVCDGMRFNDRYLWSYDPHSCSLKLLRKATHGGMLSLDEAMDLIATMLRTYQLQFVATEGNLANDVVFMPFLFIRPKPGTQFRGNDGLLYTVESLINNPVNRRWEGLVEFDRVIPTDTKFQFSYVLNDGVQFFAESPASPSGNRETASAGPIEESTFVPTITWTVIKREPGVTAGRANRSDAPRELKPRLREAYKDLDNPGYTVGVYGQVFDCTVKFDCWSTDGRSAASLMQWFEHFIYLHTWILQERGLGQMIFQSQDLSPGVQKWRAGTVSRSLTYYIRTEKIHLSMMRDLTNLSISTELVSTTEVCDPRWIADQFVTGQLTETAYQQLFRDLDGKQLFMRIALTDHGGS
jgi:hypothetical protein